MVAKKEADGDKRYVLFHTWPNRDRIKSIFLKNSLVLNIGCRLGFFCIFGYMT